MKVFASIAFLLLTSATSLCAQSDGWVFKPADPPAAAAEPIGPITIQVEAKVVLDAPSSCRIGELVRLDASESVADNFKWLLIPDSVDFLVFDDGRRAVFSARMSGEFRIVLAVAKNGSVDVVTHLIRVKDPPACPESDDLALLIPFWNWTIELPSDECLALAECFEKLSERTDLQTPEDWIRATVEANRAVLGARIDIWRPLLDKISENLVQKAQNGSLVSPEDHQKEWKRIAEGLRNA